MARPPRALRITLDTYSPSDTFREKAAQQYPWMRFDAVLEHWRDFHRAKGDTIKDFDASLRTWLRNERAPAGGGNVVNLIGKDRERADVAERVLARRGYGPA